MVLVSVKACSQLFSSQMLKTIMTTKTFLGKSNSYLLSAVSSAGNTLLAHASLFQQQNITQNRTQNLASQTFF